MASERASGRGAGALRVVVADDEPDVLFLLRLQLRMVPGIEVVGTATNGSEAIDKCKQLAPDAVVMDLLMPVTSGFQAIERLRSELPGVRVVAYTAMAGEYVRQETSRMGIDLVLKTGSIQRLASVLLEGPAA